MRWSFALLACLFAWPAAASTLADGEQCLEANDVPCAKEVVSTLGATSSSDPDAVAFAAETAFYDGHFDDAYDLLKKATGLGWKDQYGDLALYQRTREVTKDWTEVRRGRFVIRYQPGVDAVLLDDAFRVLTLAEKHFTPILGDSPPGKLELELYPDGTSFIAASSLTRQDVQTTGVVALSKWSRLLVTSPRALGRGYTWQDTIAHEDVHRIVAYQTDDKAPVWLQEAIAKYLQDRWPDGKDHFRLSVGSQGLLADAIQTGDFVTFQEMYPSFAKLPTAARAALAYAQVSTLMAYCFHRGGDGVLLRALPLVKQGEDPKEALASAAGASSFDDLIAGWHEYIEGLNLVHDDIQPMPTVLDGGNDLDSDPTLADRKDLARFVRLGDLLEQQNRHRAALVEYHKAVPDQGPKGPLLSNRLAQVDLALGHLDEAEQELQSSLVDYPEFAPTHKTLGQILRKKGDTNGALKAYQEAADLNPFDPEVQRALADLSKSVGDQAGASRHMRYLRILRPNI